MKIGILTQPLAVNYGGLLQAFALQCVLKKMGHDVLVINIELKKSLYIHARKIAGLVYRKYFQKKIYFNSKKTSEQHVSKFKKTYIKTTDELFFVDKLSGLSKYNFDAYIVGSDQVWRPKFSPGITAFFLDFLDANTTIKRIAYAASFGVDAWEYSFELTNKCKELAARFDAISVREDSAVNLCNVHLEIESKHLVDPTMLLEVEDYISVIEENKELVGCNMLAEYILDKDDTKDLIVKKIANKLYLNVNSMMPKSKHYEVNDENINDCVFISVSQWLDCIYNADFVVTDSFHGVIFSIIFNKNFIAIGNDGRGMARFSSLLKMFNLEDRLVSSASQVNHHLLESRIDFSSVNHVLKVQRNKSFSFLKEALS
ncbi:MAG: polysaccharide pyruvyl transferase family protein [Desulfobulbus sp.]|nr:polysaccharide pyruvyl transferase family protein [Desulfobulbus sp.]